MLISGCKHHGVQCFSRVQIDKKRNTDWWAGAEGNPVMGVWCVEREPA